jgi:tRNA nucleotidyltransferase/poly(A) polymerase
MTRIDRHDEFVRSLGVEAYRVGGSVRDEILGREPKDADYIVRGITLTELAERCAKAGDKAKPLTDRQGQQFGVRTAKRGIEIALPRAERNAGEGREQLIWVHPNLTLAEDAKRRDFTFNALYRRVDTAGRALMGVEIEDPTGTGVHDLQHRIVRTTHQDSFRDDPLRTLRALRFVSTLDADIEPFTLLQMRVFANKVTGLTHNGHTSGTVFDEFSKLLMGQQPAKALTLAAEHGVLAAAMPELAAMIGFEGGPYHDLTVDEHTFKAIQTAANVDARLRVRWALLFHDAGKPEAAWISEGDGRVHFYENIKQGKEAHEAVSERLWRAAAKRMNVPRRFIEDVATIIREHMVADKHRAPQVWVNRMRVKLGDDLLRDLLMHRSCDFAAKKTATHFGIRHMKILESYRQEAQEAKVPTSVKELKINGADAKAAGHEGAAIGMALRRVLDEVVCDPTSLKLSRGWQSGRL